MKIEIEKLTDEELKELSGICLSFCQNETLKNLVKTAREEMDKRYQEQEEITKIRKFHFITPTATQYLPDVIVEAENEDEAIDMFYEEARKRVSPCPQNWDIDYDGLWES